jgi:hypothetical protein
MHQSTGRVGSEHWWFEDRGPQCTLLVFVDVDLYQFANAIASRPRLVDAFALLTIAPQAGFDHPLVLGFWPDVSGREVA